MVFSDVVATCPQRSVQPAAATHEREGGSVERRGGTSRISGSVLIKLYFKPWQLNTSNTDIRTTFSKSAAFYSRPLFTVTPNCFVVAHLQTWRYVPRIPDGRCPPPTGPEGGGGLVWKQWNYSCWQRSVPLIYHAVKPKYNPAFLHNYTEAVDLLASRYSIKVSHQPNTEIYLRGSVAWESWVRDPPPLTPAPLTASDGG